MPSIKQKKSKRTSRQQMKTQSASRTSSRASRSSSVRDRSVYIPSVLIPPHQKNPHKRTSKSTPAATVQAVAARVATKNYGALSPLVASVVTPLHHSCRVPDAFSTRATALAAPWLITTASFSGPAGSSEVMPPGTYAAAVSRDPLNAIVQYVPNPGLLPWTYRLHFLDSSISGIVNDVTAWAVPVGTTGRYPLRPQWAYDQYNGATGALHPHGPVTFSKVHNEGGRELGWFWVDGTVAHASNISIAYSISITGNNYARLLRTNGCNSDEVSAVQMSGFQTTFPIATAGWYALAFELTTTGVPFTITVDLLGTCDCIGHLPMPGIASRIAAVTTLRVIGASLMFTPDSAELARGGRIIGAQTEGRQWPEVYMGAGAGFGLTFGNTLGTRADATSLDATNGMYAFHAPTSPDDIAFQTPFTFAPSFIGSADMGASVSGNVIDCYISPMFPPGGWLVIGVDTPMSTTATNYPGGLFHLTYGFAVEFAGIDPWYVYTPSTGVTTAMDAAFNMLRRCPNFVENPTHMAQIKAFFAGKARSFWTQLPGRLHAALPMLAKAIGLAFPEVAVAANVASAMFG